MLFVQVIGLAERPASPALPGAGRFPCLCAGARERPGAPGVDTYACNLTARHPGKMTHNVGKMTQMLGNNWAKYVC